MAPGPLGVVFDSVAEGRFEVGSASGGGEAAALGIHVIDLVETGGVPGDSGFRGDPQGKRFSTWVV